MKLRSTKTVVAIACVFTLALVSGMAYASIPDSDGTIHACVIKGSGLVRVIDSASEACKATETPLNISQGLSNPHRVDGGQLFDETPVKLMVARCPDGERATGGGFDVVVNRLEDGTLPDASPIIEHSAAGFSTHDLAVAQTPDQWVAEAVAQHGFADSWGLTAYVDCVRFGP